MKRRRFVIVFVIAVLAFTFMPVKSFADILQGWHSVTIVEAGPFFDLALMKVKSAPGNRQSFTEQWLQLNLSTQNQLLATALSAIAMQMEVKIWVYEGSKNIAGYQTQRCAAILLDNN